MGARVSSDTSGHDDAFWNACVVCVCICDERVAMERSVCVCVYVAGTMDTVSSEETVSLPPTSMSLIQFSVSMFNEFPDEVSGAWAHRVVFSVLELGGTYGVTVSVNTTRVRRLDVVDLDVHPGTHGAKITKVPGLAVRLEGEPVVVLVPYDGVLRCVNLQSLSSPGSQFVWRPLVRRIRATPASGHLRPPPRNAGGDPRVRLSEDLPPLDSPVRFLEPVSNTTTRIPSTHFEMQRHLGDRCIAVDVLLESALSVLYGNRLAAARTVARILQSIMSWNPNQLFVQSFCTSPAFLVNDFSVFFLAADRVELAISTKSGGSFVAEIAAGPQDTEEGDGASTGGGSHGSWTITWRDTLLTGCTEDDDSDGSDSVVIMPPSSASDEEEVDIWKFLSGTPLWSVWTASSPSSFAVDTAPSPPIRFVGTGCPSSLSCDGDAVPLHTAMACVTFLLAWKPHASNSKFMTWASPLSRPFVRDARSCQLLSKFVLASSDRRRTVTDPRFVSRVISGPGPELDEVLGAPGPTWPTCGTIQAHAVQFRLGLKEGTATARAAESSLLALLAPSPAAGVEGVPLHAESAISDQDMSPACAVNEFRAWCIPVPVRNLAESHISPWIMGILLKSGVWDTAMAFLEDASSAAAPLFEQRRALACIVRVALLHGTKGVSLRALREFLLSRTGHFVLSFSPRRRLSTAGDAADDDDIIQEVASGDESGSDGGLCFFANGRWYKHFPRVGFITLKWHDDAATATGEYTVRVVIARPGLGPQQVLVDVYDQLAPSPGASLYPFVGPRTANAGYALLRDEIGWTAWSSRTAYRISLKPTVSSAADLTRVSRSAYARGARSFFPFAQPLSSAHLETSVSTLNSVGKKMLLATQSATGEGEKCVVECATIIARALAVMFVDADMVSPSVALSVMMERQDEAKGGRRAAGTKYEVVLRSLTLMSLISACRLVVAFTVTETMLKWWLVPVSECPPGADPVLEEYSQATAPLFMFWGPTTGTDAIADAASTPIILGLEWHVPEDVMTTADMLHPALFSEVAISRVAEVVATARRSRLSCSAASRGPRRRIKTSSSTTKAGSMSGGYDDDDDDLNVLGAVLSVAVSGVLASSSSSSSSLCSSVDPPSSASFISGDTPQLPSTSCHVAATTVVSDTPLGTP